MGRKETQNRSRSCSCRSPTIAIRNGDWKLPINADGVGMGLDNLATDRNEAHKLAAEKPVIITRLTDAALTWHKSLP